MPDNRDRQLLTRFLAENDAESLDCLIRRHGDLVFGVCSRVLRNRHDAEDAFQATFLILVSRPPKLRRRASLGGWLFRVAHRTSMRVARERRRLVEFDDPLLPAPEPFEDVYKQESVLALDEELSALPERYRAPLVLCSLMGKSRSEAASELGRTEASIKASLTRGKHMLRTRLLRRGILLSVAAAAGKQFMASPAFASGELVQLTSSLCGGNPAAPGPHVPPSPEIQSLANSGVREMTTAFSSKLAASAVAATVVVGGVLIADIEAPKPAGAMSPLGTTTLVNAGDGELPPFTTGQSVIESSAGDITPPVQLAADDFLPPGGAFPANIPLPNAGPAGTVQAYPPQQFIQNRAVENEQSRDELLIDLEYHRMMADAMEMKAEAKQLEARATGATDEEQDVLMQQSRELFAIAESREFSAEAARLSAQANLLEERLQTLGEPNQSTQNNRATRMGGPVDTIEPGDLLGIQLAPDPDGIWGRRELTVSPEGMVTLPYVGEIKATGLTVLEFGDRLVKYYTAGNVFENPTFMMTHTHPARSEQQLQDPNSVPETAQPASSNPGSAIQPLESNLPDNPDVIRGPSPDATLPAETPLNPVSPAAGSSTQPVAPLDAVDENQLPVPAEPAIDF